MARPVPVEIRQDIVLSIEEKLTPVWRKIVKHYEHRLDELRQQNDSDFNELTTAKLRGRIIEVKVLLALNNDPPNFDEAV